MRKAGLRQKSSWKTCRQLQILLCLVIVVLSSSVVTAAEETEFRPPSVPLVACDPYFSIWSSADALNQVETSHWTGSPHRLHAYLTVDGQVNRLMGAEPKAVPAMKQVSLEVLPTKTIYQFENKQVHVDLTFLTPALPEDVLLLSRPVTYVTCAVTSLDGKEHEVSFHFDAGGELATDKLAQPVVGEKVDFDTVSALKIGSKAQQVLVRSGDDLRIDWGYLYVAVPKSNNAKLQFHTREAYQQVLAKPQTAISSDVQFPVKAGEVIASAVIDFGVVGAKKVQNYLILAYDDIYSIEFMHNKLRPYWRKDGWVAADLLKVSVKEYASLTERCDKFDKQLMDDLRTAGGQKYAEICALAYRQCFAAGKFVADANGQPLQFSKENFSNGCIATSDILYPMAPQFLLFGPTMTKAFLAPFMEYAASERWKFPFAPHDLGTYPKANGQVYGGGETSERDQMPVEESGNILILFAALAKMENNAEFAKIYWPQLSKWAAYLEEKGFDPDNQLCTDDFAGHMAHNVNLSAKAIMGLGAYALLCEMNGQGDEAQRVRKIAKGFAERWVKEAKDGDHTRLAFDRPGTWSQKYNLVWDRLLGFNLFPKKVFESEMAFYRKSQNKYGLPLDNRSDYTKLDWILWTATLTGNADDFKALMEPVHLFLNESPDRAPMGDWYFTSSAKKQGFTARPVVGGVFLQMLYDEKAWSKYASQDVTKASGWADLPVAPEMKPIVETAERAKVTWAYTLSQPDDQWTEADFDDSSWKRGVGGFGKKETPSAIVGTEWSGSDIWLRREFNVEKWPENVVLRMHYDEDVLVYLNGVQIADFTGWTTDYSTFEIPREQLRAGRNVLAIHCRQKTGGQFIDAGFDSVAPAK
jgi:hypothetical protein